MYSAIIIFTKLFSFILRLSRLGSGNTWPGHFVLKLFPKLVLPARYIPRRGFVLISGTNGKTTTAKLIVHALRKKGFSVITNASGANLLNGIVSSLLLNSPIFGSTRYDYAVFEVDEFAVTDVSELLPPSLFVLLNLSRDQLDRYGEVDIIFERWVDVLKQKPCAAVVYDGSSVLLQRLARGYLGELVDYRDVNLGKVNTAFVSNFFPENIQAALAALRFLGVSQDFSENALSDFKPAYGRGESVVYKNKKIQFFLAKNPASLSLNLGYLSQARGKNYDSLLFVLNDNIPDGRDVSWIYDVEPSLFPGACEGKKVFVAGKRCYDMAVRIDYSGVHVPSQNIFVSIKSAVSAISSDKDVESVAVLPNYSAMLDLRKILVGRKIL